MQPRSTPLPYTTLFRSRSGTRGDSVDRARVPQYPRGAPGLPGRTRASTAPVSPKVPEFTVARERRSQIRHLTDEIGRATSELQSHVNLVCRLLLVKKNY